MKRGVAVAVSRDGYLADLADALALRWPENRVVNIVCHGHSVPAGYACTPLVRPLAAYPHQLRALLAERFPYAVFNVIVTAIGGENSAQGAERFERDVLTHVPDLVTIDYGLNDRAIGLETAEAAWRSMIEKALSAGAKVILLTPSLDNAHEDAILREHVGMIRRLADAYAVGLADSYRAWTGAIARGEALNNLLSHVNHPSERGHALIAAEIAAWFPPR